MIVRSLAAGRRQNPQAGRLRYTLSLALIGGTGDWPVPVGDSPTGMPNNNLRKMGFHLEGFLGPPLLAKGG